MSGNVEKTACGGHKTAAFLNSPAGVDLSQPGCLIEGMCRVLSFVEGNFAVILHSELDCANMIFRDGRAVDPRRFFCTNLSERDLLEKGGAEKLRRALVEVTEYLNPRLIFVLGGCLASLAGEEVGAICSDMKLKAKIVTLSGAAFGKVGQGELLDTFCRLMIEKLRPPKKASTKRLVLLGYPRDDAESQKILKRAGIEVFALGPYSPLYRWEDLEKVKLVALSDGLIFSRTAQGLRQAGWQVVEIPPPIGLRRCEEFYRKLLEFSDTEQKAAEFSRAEKSEAHQAQEPLKGRRLRLAYHLGSRKDYQLEDLVGGGLLELEFFEELGWEVELFFQGAVEEERRREIEKFLRAYGKLRPFTCLPDRLSLARVLREKGIFWVYCNESLREQARAAGAGVIPQGTIRPGFSGVVESCRRLEILVGHDR